MQLFNAWICVCVLPPRSQFGELRIFHLARLLLRFNENIRAFLQKLNIFDGRLLISKFQFLIVVFETFCCTDESSVFCSFNFVIDVMILVLNFVIDVIISFWILLSMLWSRFEFRYRCYDLVLNFVIDVMISFWILLSMLWSRFEFCYRCYDLVLNFFIDVMISFWISLSSVDFATFAFAERLTILSFLMFFIAVISNSS